MTDLSPLSQRIRDAVLATYDEQADRESLWIIDCPQVVAALMAAADNIDFDPWLVEHQEYTGVLRNIALELRENND
jgi:hypothetical protein